MQLKPVQTEKADLARCRRFYRSAGRLHNNCGPGGCSMEDADIEQRLHLLQKEIEASATLMRECKLDLMAAIDSLRIESEVLKSYMERYHPGFAESYPKFKEEAIQAIDPEWIGSKAGKRLEGR